jgi:hypothetical protein
MPRLNRELVEHRLSIKSGFMPYKQPARRFNPFIHDRVKRRWKDYSMPDLFDLVDMWSGFSTSYPWKRRTPAKFGYV